MRRQLPYRGEIGGGGVRSTVPVANVTPPAVNDCNAEKLKPSFTRSMVRIQVPSIGAARRAWLSSTLASSKREPDLSFWAWAIGLSPVARINIAGAIMSRLIVCLLRLFLTLPLLFLLCIDFHRGSAHLGEAGSRRMLLAAPGLYSRRPTLPD